MKEGTITEGQILTGVMFNEPMRVITTRQGGTGTVIAGLVGQSSGQFREVTLTAEDIAQLRLFPEEAPTVRGRARRGRQGTSSPADIAETTREPTTLDRLHAGMLLQASGRTEALRTLIRAEQERGPDFLRLANALTALYPRGSDEKRLLDGMLLAAPR